MSWRCRRCYNDIQTGLRGKYRQAIAARTGDWSTGSSTASGEEDRKSKTLEAEKTELRARIEALEKKGGEGAQGGQSLPPRGEGGARMKEQAARIKSIHQEEFLCSRQQSGSSCWRERWNSYVHPWKRRQNCQGMSKCAWRDANVCSIFLAHGWMVTKK